MIDTFQIIYSCTKNNISALSKIFSLKLFKISRIIINYMHLFLADIVLCCCFSVFFLEWGTQNME